MFYLKNKKRSKKLRLRPLRLKNKLFINFVALKFINEYEMKEELLKYLRYFNMMDERKILRPSIRKSKRVLFLRELISGF